MACCAFAVFLLLNLLIPIGFLRRSAISEKQNPAVAWRFQGINQTTVEASTANQRKIRPASAVFAVYITGATLLAISWLDSDPASKEITMTDEQWDAFALLNVSWCLGSNSDTATDMVIGAAR